MTEKLKRLFAKLTPARRRKIYAITAAIGTLLVAKRLVSAEDARAILEIVGIALGIIGVPTMALVKVNDE